MISQSRYFSGIIYHCFSQFWLVILSVRTYDAVCLNRSAPQKWWESLGQKVSLLASLGFESLMAVIVYYPCVTKNDQRDLAWPPGLDHVEVLYRPIRHQSTDDVVVSEILQ